MRFPQIKKTSVCWYTSKSSNMAATSWSMTSHAKIMKRLPRSMYHVKTAWFFCTMASLWWLPSLSKQWVSSTDKFTLNLLQKQQVTNYLLKCFHVLSGSRFNHLRYKSLPSVSVLKPCLGSNGSKSLLKTLSARTCVVVRIFKSKNSPLVRCSCATRAKFQKPTWLF